MAPQFEVLETFIRENSRWIHGAAFNLTDDREAAVELAQEAAYRTLKNWDRYDVTRPLKSWYSTILGHAHIDGQRLKDNQWVSLDSPLDDGDGTVGDAFIASDEAALERLDRIENRHLLEMALGQLSPLYRRILILRDIDGLEYEEVARRIGIPMGTVRSRLHKAREKLREQWRNLSGSEGLSRSVRASG